MRNAIGRYVCATLTGLALLVATGFSIAWQVEDAQLLAAREASQIAPPPEGSVPTGTAMPPAQPPLTSLDRRTLDRAIWRDPLEPKFFNLLYADSVRIGRSDDETRQRALLLSQLGWRYTPAQQNLMFRALLEGRFREVVDHADALLRRQKLPALAYAVLTTMEAIPQVHHYVLGKLAARPTWRRDYLSVIGPQSGADLLDARILTLATLLRSRQGLSREEMAPSLIALVGIGRGPVAYDLWMRRAGRRSDNNLIFDPRFEQVSAFTGAADLGIPFEWRVSQNLGYGVQAASKGVTIDWDRRGVPAFVSQTVPLTPGRSYGLVLRGAVDGGSLQKVLAPRLTCAGIEVAFQPLTDVRQGEAQFRSDRIPGGCDTGVLTIGGGLDAGSGGVNIDISEVILRIAD